MQKKNAPYSPPGMSRRQVLRRLGVGVVAGYVVPEMLMLSQARAASSGSAASDGSDPSDSSDPSGPSGSSIPTPPTPPTAPSNVDELETDDAPTDNCRQGPVPDGTGAPVISQRDFAQANKAVEAGYAKPLNQIWGQITTDYPGRIIGVEFTGFRWRPRYRLRAISASGRLETVIVSARTGLIIRIAGC